MLLDRDVAEAFPDGTTVNQALRALIRVAETKIRGARHRLAPRPLQPAGRAKRKAEAKPRSRAARG